MPRFGAYSDTFSEPWEEVTTAHWKKYPNPLSSHVLSADTLHRHVDPETGCMKSTRLLTKTNSSAKWMARFLGDRTSTYIVEESVLDPRAKTLTTFTKNITLNNLMTIEEKCIYSVSEENPNWTTCQTQAKVTSGLLIGNMVEKFGIDRFQNNSAKAKQSIVYVLGKMKEKSATGLAKVAKVAKIAKTAKTATCAGEAA